MSKITSETVTQIATLARLKLSEAEIEKYQLELSAILSYIDIIQKVDVVDVIPAGQVTGLCGVVREDIKKPSDLTRDDIFINTPDKKDGYIKVKPVLD